LIPYSAPAPLPALSVSLVTFNPDFGVLAQVVASLLAAVRRTTAHGLLEAAGLIVVDNGPSRECGVRLQKLLNARWDDATFSYNIISGHGNVGYGQGHNKAIERSAGDYHLILNPDVLIAEDAITEAVQFMERNRDVGLLAPAIMTEDGKLQHLCKNYPTVLDLALRGFAPAFLKAYARRRLAHYEMERMDANSVRRGVPLVSGSFMFFRRRVLERTGGFSRDYFLYFEDFDLSLRAAEFATVCYVPSVRIVHRGGFASKKGLRHWWMFGRSACTFFSHHGWKWH
jgi:GT2 family glycosyltransferase